MEDCETKIKELAMRKDMENIQSIVYQTQYQQAIKGQLEGILEQLHGDSFATVSDYLARCYEDGYLGTMYDLAGQGIPLIIPIDQSQVVQAIQTDSKLSKSLYERLGEDVNALKKSVRQEVSRGIASGSSWVDVATNMASNFKNTPFSKAFNYSVRIARTEGHRIGIQAAMDAQEKAKKKGADIVKQWDATLDGRTRDSHRLLDGQIRELDEDFEVNGKHASAPAMFGDPSEDVNCRCALLQRARWALDDDELETLREKAAYHGTLVDDSEAYGHAKAKDFSDFKSKYLKAADALVRLDAQKMKTLENSGKSSTIEPKNISNVSTGGKRNEVPLSEKEIAECEEFARQLGFHGDIAYSNYSNTAFVGSVEGEKYCRLVIGTDVKPMIGTIKELSPNQLVSTKGALAHEIVGHYEAWLGGFECEIKAVDEAQASIRAARFAEGLSKEERYMLIRDALCRLNTEGINLSEARKMMKIERR